MLVPKAQHSLFHFLYRYLLGHGWLIVADVITVMVFALATVGEAALLRRMINEVASMTGGAVQSLHGLGHVAMAYVMVLGAIGLTFRAKEWLRLHLIPGLKQDVLLGAWAHVSGHTHRYFQTHFAGSLSNKLYDLSHGMTHLYTLLIDGVCGQILLLLMALWLMSTIHVVFALILCLWALCFIAASVLFARKAAILAITYSESVNQTMGQIVESITHIFSLRIFVQMSGEYKRIQASMVQACRHDQRMQWQVLCVRLGQDVAMVVLVAAMLGAIMIRCQRHVVSIGDVVLLLTLTVTIFRNLWYVAAQCMSFSETVGRCCQAMTVLMQPHGIKDLPSAQSIQITQGRIEFDQVVFGYADALFKGIALQIPAYCKLGVVGVSGSGKSTLAQLLLRIVEPASGCILIDGQDISTITQASLRQSVALVAQDIQLFHRSVMENIRYGHQAASDQAVVAAAKQAGCHDFISRLPQQYETVVGARGFNLSEGQRQRIAIARAVLKDVPIVVFDEATSALDVATEQAVYQGLMDWMCDRTTIIISHRLASLVNMDSLVVLDRGEIVEVGSHHGLLEQGGVYASMWQLQAAASLSNAVLHSVRPIGSPCIV